MKVTRWEPFKEMEDFFRQYSPLYSRALREADSAGADWAPVANISETPTEYLIKADLPAVKKEDIKVTVDHGVITISGERKHEKESKDENQIRIESFHGTFTRSFSLPDDVDPAGITAESKDGVLRVRLPRTAAQKPKSVAVEVK